MKNLKRPAYVLMASLLLGSLPSISEAKVKIVAPPASDDQVTLTEAAELLSPTEMKDLRGGFIDTTGLICNFAVNVETLINGIEVFTKNITVAATGTGSELQASANATLALQNLSSALKVSFENDGSGLTIAGANGQTTTVINQTSGGAPSSIVINTADNTDITQSVSVSLTLATQAAVAKYVNATARTALMNRVSIRSLGF